MFHPHPPRREVPLHKRPEIKPYQIKINHPPCECCDCDQQFRNKIEQCYVQTHYTGKVSELEAGRIIAGHVKNIQADREYLKLCCASHGNTILGRWKKRSRGKRATLLLKAELEMYQQQWFIARLSQDLPNVEIRTYRKAWLAPNLNVEVLKTDYSSFLSLLDSRTRCSPEQWVPYDNYHPVGASELVIRITAISAWSCTNQDVVR